ncbi:MAG: PDZ domain-containing protein [Deltaproteobacteria bacterium]|nr:PDZ domain-containing protein [Deltaproteobacteria bacterium]
MNNEGKLCPHNFPLWVAFLMGMVVIIIAIVVFDLVSIRGRMGLDVARSSFDVTSIYQGTSSTQAGLQPASYTKDGEGETGAWLGIEPADVTEDMAKQLGLNISGGVLISKVIEGSPAEKAGLLQGDIIYELDRSEVETSDGLRQLLSESEPGERVRIVLFRDSKRKVIYAKLGEPPEGSTSSVRQIAGEIIPNDLKWGIVVSELTESLRKAYGIPGNENGVIVLMVAPGSAANTAGIIKGDMIRQVGETRIYDLADFFEAIDSSDNRSFLLNIRRQNTQLYVNIVAVSPLLPVGGPAGSEEDDSTEESEGLKGIPAEIPPQGKPEVSSTQQSQGFTTAQEGIGMNRPLYVPGYDQTQSGEPEDKATPSLKVISNTVTGNSDSDDDSPVCKRIQDMTLIL